MQFIVNYPLLVFVLTTFLLWIAGRIGVLVKKKLGPLDDHDHKDLDVVNGASLGLLALLIGFTFSMALGHYDLRKRYEEEEANAIGTEYLRADLVGLEAGPLRESLKKYLDQRLLFYEARNETNLRKLYADTAQLQNELWSRVHSGRLNAQPPAAAVLALSGMNDVLNSEGYTQAAWWNRIPISAWILMELIATGCSLLMGYSSYRPSRIVLFVVPLSIGISFFLIADIDSPRGGLIRVHPRNLVRLAHSLQHTD